MLNQGYGIIFVSQSKNITQAYRRKQTAWLMRYFNFIVVFLRYWISDNHIFADCV